MTTTPVNKVRPELFNFTFIMTQLQHTFMNFIVPVPFLLLLLPFILLAFANIFYTTHYSVMVALITLFDRSILVL